MTLACARLGCTERAHTVLVFEPGSAAAWLMHAVEAHRTQGILLCRTHADVITVPLGWNLVDERDPTWEPVVSTSSGGADPDPVATALDVPDPGPSAADVVELPAASGPAEAEAKPAVASGSDSDDVGTTTGHVAEPGDAEAAFEEVVAAQWTGTGEEPAAPTLFAVDDDEESAGSGALDADGNETDGSTSEIDRGPSRVDTPLLSRAFRAAERS